MPVNFSRTDLESTHTMSAEAVLAITLVTCQKSKLIKKRTRLKSSVVCGQRNDYQIMI